MTNTENNTKIAKFLGYEIIEGYQGKGIMRQGQYISLCKLKYHKDWNWLIGALNMAHKKSETSQYDLLHWRPLNDALLSRDIETVYNSLVNFVGWYNNSPQQIKTEKK